MNHATEINNLIDKINESKKYYNSEEFHKSVENLHQRGINALQNLILTYQNLFHLFKENGLTIPYDNDRDSGFIIRKDVNGNFHLDVDPMNKFFNDNLASVFGNGNDVEYKYILSNDKDAIAIDWVAAAEKAIVCLKDFKIPTDCIKNFKFYIDRTEELVDMFEVRFIEELQKICEENSKIISSLNS